MIQPVHWIIRQTPNYAKYLNNNLRTQRRFLIAQRIGSIQHADKILVLENGRMSGFGDHATLLATNTIYLEIYHGQTGGRINA